MPNLIETQNQMLQTIEVAKSKGFMTLDDETVEYNYSMALEFEKLDPWQQQVLSYLTKK